MITRFDGDDGGLEFDGITCRIWYRDAASQGWLRRRLGVLVVPLVALRDVQVNAPGLMRSGRLSLLPRHGADPIAAVAGDSLPSDDLPYFVEFSRKEHDEASRVAARLRSAIDATGLADVPADEFMIEVGRPPVTATGLDGTARFDGESVTLTWNGRGRSGKSDAQTIPLAALDSVEWRDRKGLRTDDVLFRTVGDATPSGLRRLEFAGDRQKADTLILAASVASRLRTFGDAAPAPPLTREASADSPLVLHGPRGRAEFDGSVVLLTSQGLTRTIPVPAIERVEMLETPDGSGFVRVHLTGAESDARAVEPALDVNAVAYGDEPSALEFTLQVTRALGAVTRIPDRELLRTTGLRRDLERALSRASTRVRGMPRELVALTLALEPAEELEEVEMAIARNVVVVALTARRLLVVEAGEHFGDHFSVPLTEFAGAAATWDDDDVGEIVFHTRNGADLAYHGVYDPARFRRTLRRLAAGAQPVPSAPDAVGGSPSPATTPSPAAAPHWPLRPDPSGAWPDVAGALSRTTTDLASLRREFDMLTGAFLPGEILKEVESARHKRRDGLLGLTNRRLLFARQNGEVTGIALDQVLYMTLYLRKRTELKVTTGDLDTLEFKNLRQRERFQDAIDAMRGCPARAIVQPDMAFDSIVTRPEVAEALSRSRRDVLALGPALPAAFAELDEGEEFHELEPVVFAGEEGLLALTGRRLLFVGPEGLRTIKIALIGGISVRPKYTEGWAALQLQIMDSDRRLTYCCFQEKDAIRFEKSIRKLLQGLADGEPSSAPSQTAPAPTAQEDVLDQIRKLGELREAGLLTEQEFQAKKTELLGRH
ncbi:DUF4429 domain-containing protein [Spirillospora sp. NPDC046719]